MGSLKKSNLNLNLKANNMVVVDPFLYWSIFLLHGLLRGKLNDCHLFNQRKQNLLLIFARFPFH